MRGGVWGDQSPHSYLEPLLGPPLSHDNGGSHRHIPEIRIIWQVECPRHDHTDRGVAALPPRGQPRVVPADLKGGGRRDNSHHRSPVTGLSTDRTLRLMLQRDPCRMHTVFPPTMTASERARCSKTMARAGGLVTQAEWPACVAIFPSSVIAYLQKQG